jgi:uncharacterized repeat protein (TIGR01451 family)
VDLRPTKEGWMDMRRTVVLSASAALAVLLVGVAALLWTQQAKAQEPCDPRIYCIDKTANPSTVTVGERITFTITDRCAINTCLAFGALVDELPSGLRIESVEDSDPNFQCSTNVNTVTCPEVTFTSTQPFTVTIVATTTKCGTFTNTASDGSRSGQASFTVEHCVPTTKAQCKNGGWRDLGWPDQGTCITAVNQNRP